MKYEEIINQLKPGEIAEVEIKGWQPFKKTFVFRDGNRLLFQKRLKKARTFTWGYDQDKEYTIKKTYSFNK